MLRFLTDFLANIFGEDPAFIGIFNGAHDVANG